MDTVRHAPDRIVQLYVFVCGACCPYVSLVHYVPVLDRTNQFSESIFRTSHRDVNINETSSYVDLSPLYGNNEETLNKIRAHDGRGSLLPDTFAEERLLLLPPAVCALLVLFNRNHNVSF